jgi:uncharacterized OB-fold protein
MQSPSEVDGHTVATQSASKVDDQTGVTQVRPEVDDQDGVIAAATRRIAARGYGPPRPGRDPVNLPIIRNWLEAIGGEDPVYTDAEFAAASQHGGLVAPPAMIQVWTMPGLHRIHDLADPLPAMSEVLSEAGFTSVVATNCEQTYHRYLQHGEHVTVRSRLGEVVGPKRTALGEGWFVTTHSTWYAGEEPVAEMVFRVLKFRPPAAPPPGSMAAAPLSTSTPAALPPGSTPNSGSLAPAPGRTPTAPPGLRPVISPDTAFFWAGTAIGELRIQKCETCGTLRHPPGPMCSRCGATDPGYVVAAGTGVVYSYVVHRHPPVPGKQAPIVIALVELAEGVRMVGELLDVAPERVRIGMPVVAAFVQVDDKLTLSAWREQDPDVLPELRIEVTPTFVVTTAIATRDFQDVHHDRDLAIARGSRDIFVNILTTTGLVQRYVTDWAGPTAVVREIAIRLGVPCYAYDTLTFRGRVIRRQDDESVIEVVGRNSLGDHVTGKVQIGWL